MPRSAAETTSKPGPAPVAPPFSRRAALVLLALVIVVWGVNWPVMKVGLAYLPPFVFALLRLAMGAACLFALLLARGALRVPGRADLPVLLSVGLLQLTGFLALANLGLEYVEAGRSAILSYTTLIWVTPLAVVLLGERLTRRKALGFALGLGGVVALFNPIGFDWSDADALIGNGYLLLAALCWALAILHVRHHRFRLSALQLAPWQMLLACVPVAACAAALEWDAPIRWGGAVWAVLAFNGPFATAFAFWAWISINRALPAITAAVGSLGVPAVGLAASILWLGEPLTPALAIGLALIVAGLACIATDRAADGTTDRTGGRPAPDAG